jgi:hypothetical protein
MKDAVRIQTLQTSRKQAGGEKLRPFLRRRPAFALTVNASALHLPPHTTAPAPLSINWILLH